MFLCDTNVLSELARPTPDGGVLEWARRVPRMAVSVVTVEEILFGLTWKPNERIRAWFEGFADGFCEVLPVTPEVARRGGELRGELRGQGQVRTQADMLIAATAQIHQLTVVTRNVRDFERTGVPILNPFQEG